MSLAGDSIGQYTITDDFSSSGSVVENLIQKIHNGDATIQDIVNYAPELEAVLENKHLIGAFADITVSNATKNENGNYEVILSVPSLVEQAVNVRVLHYSTVRSKWEIIIPSNVDFENKLVITEFQDLSPVAVIADIPDSVVNSENVKSNELSPKTGEEANWYIWFTIAVIFFGCAVVLLKRTRR